MKFSIIPLIIVFFSTTLKAQESVNPGSGGFNASVFRPGTKLIKLSWINKDGNIAREATLTCITRIDSVNKRLTYLQIRNDGKKDSTVSEWPSLLPLYSCSVFPDKTLIFNYSDNGRQLEAKTLDKSGRIIKDTTYNLGKPGFDSYLTDCLVGALPLKPGYTGKFIAGSGTPYIVSIIQVNTDVWVSETGSVRQLYLVNADYNGYKVLYWISKSTGEMVKFIVQQADGGIFMKSAI
jgi:hypothetical protein